MKKYKVERIEKHCIEYLVEANSAEEAYKIAEEYDDDKIISTSQLGEAVDDADLGVSTISGPY
jgi:hypothetical protein